MGDPIPKTREVTDYYIICDKCGKEELSEFNRPQELCRTCQDKKDVDKAYGIIAFMKGATVTDVTLLSDYSQEVESITILTPDGKEVIFEVDRFCDHPYIEWNCKDKEE
ncbi:MAG: hypothetical protein KAQ92_08500 [Candidatus Aenigmarchaeota archaeon]|nr:hypothetical protein [Candidatus Aenigmarchaeota archaeon]